jgi:UDP-N-acetylmuramoyl-tripeptide--D-alanyl-D-alanine ligase
MKPLRLEEIRTALKAHRLTRGDDVTVTGVSIDSRTAQEGDLFFAIRGPRFDGKDFLEAARQVGCSAGVIHRDPTGAAPPPADRDPIFPGGLLGVTDTTDALGKLAAYHRSQCPAAVVGVTGTNGKTTVKRMVDHILGKTLTGSASPASYNNCYGVPLTLLAAQQADDYVVCEIGTNAPGEVAQLAQIARPDVAVITSIGPAHLEGLGTLERVASEKASLLGSMSRGGLAVVWADHELLERSMTGYSCRMIRFGRCDKADLRLTDSQPAGWGQRFQLNGRLWVDLPLPGEHNALNAIAAIGVAQRFGISQDQAAAALADLAGPPMRMQRIELGEVTVINDAYNANPASLAAAAGALGQMDGQRKIMVVGEMRELGASADDLHDQAGRDLAVAGVDLVVGVGEGGGRIARSAGSEGAGLEVCDDLQQAADRLGGLLRPGDVVLLKASRAVGLERLIEPLAGAMNLEIDSAGDDARGPAR